MVRIMEVKGRIMEHGVHLVGDRVTGFDRKILQFPLGRRIPALIAGNEQDRK
jgi:hypothetical protein